MNNEQGRSLTEMLGMLAIIGILSVAGVAMYNSAMNKHRANELIYEAQKRATTVAMQITAGRESLSIGEFTNPRGYVFGVEKNPNNANQFNITLDAVSTDICTQMKTSIGDGTVVRKISDDCREITFNNDLSRVGQSACLEAGKIWCAGTNYCSDTGSCCAGGNCEANECPAKSSTAGAGGSTGIFVEGAECKCDSEAEFFTANGCALQPETCSDWTKNECGFGYYCSFSYDAEKNYVGDANQCYKDLSGTCTKITDIHIPSENGMKVLHNAGFKTTFVYTPVMNWWSAYSWCLGIGKNLIPVEELRCYKASNNELVREGSGPGYCCKKNQQCQQTSWSGSLWDYTNILEGKEDEVAKFSDTIVALRKVFYKTYFWTASAQGAIGQNSCYAFIVGPLHGNLWPNPKRPTEYNAICE